jgi:hypothetical protein
LGGLAFEEIEMPWSRAIASKIAFVWKQVASRVARAMWALVVKPVSPIIRPVALSSQLKKYASIRIEYRHFCRCGAY